MLEKPTLACQPAAITGQGAVRTDDAMARHHDAVWVLPVRGANRPCRRGDAKARGKGAVGRGRPRWDPAQRCPDALLKRSPAAGDLNSIQGAQIALEIGSDPCAQTK